MSHPAILLVPALIFTLGYVLIVRRVLRRLRHDGRRPEQLRAIRRVLVLAWAAVMAIMGTIARSA